MIPNKPKNATKPINVAFHLDRISTSPKYPAYNIMKLNKTTNENTRNVMLLPMLSDVTKHNANNIRGVVIAQSIYLVEVISAQSICLYSFS